MLQPPVVEVEVEVKPDGTVAGHYLVTIGDGAAAGAAAAILAQGEQEDLSGAGHPPVINPHLTLRHSAADDIGRRMGVGLDMTKTWTATAASYFSRVRKPRVLEAVTKTVSARRREGRFGRSGGAAGRKASLVLVSSAYQNPRDFA